MKNNGVKSNVLKTKGQQIKVNRKQIEHNLNNANQSPSQNYYQYFHQKTNKNISEESKNFKFRDYLGAEAYINKNVFTEYDSSPKYSLFPLNSIKTKNVSPKDARPVYNYTNGNINKEKNLNLKNKNKLTNINTDKAMYKNYTNRELGKLRKITSFKGNKKINLLQEGINNNIKINPKNIYSQKGANMGAGPRLSESKKEIKEIQYSLNTLNNQAIKNKNKNKYPSCNPINNKNSDNNDLGPVIQKVPNREKIKKYKIISPVVNHQNDNKKKKTVRQNKSNITIINRRKNNPIISPDITNADPIPAPLKNSTSNNYYKTQTNKINNYNSCYNFYQKVNNNLRENNISYNINTNADNKTNNNSNNPSLLNSTNNFAYLNSNNSLEESNNRIHSIFSDMNNEDIYENDNISINYMKTHNCDYGNSVNYNNNNNNKRNSVYNNNSNNILYKIKKDININQHHKKGKLSENNTTLNNKRIYKVLNIGNHNKNNILYNKLIYKKNVIEEFCKILEDFIFMNINNNFDTFISKLKEYCKEKHFNNILLKRLQNKNIQKNFYKEKSSSYKYLEPNSTNPHFSSIIMMNNSNIINVERKPDFISSDFTKDYKDFYGRKTAYNFRSSHSPPLTEKVDRIQKHFRTGKSHEPLDMNSVKNINIYSNNTYFHNNNLLDNYNNFNNNFNNNYKIKYDRKRNIDLQMNIDDDEEDRKSLIKYETNFNENNTNLYIPKKLKGVNKNKVLSKSNERKNREINEEDISNPYINKIKSKKIVSKKLSPDNDNNLSQDINDDIIRTKLNKNYNINNLKNFNYNNNYRDISCDTTNLNYKINQDIEEILLNKTNDYIMKRNNTQSTYGNINDSKSKDNNLPVYRKKIKISQVKSKIYMNKLIGNDIRNKMIHLNGNNKTAGKILSPNNERNIDTSLNLNINEHFEKMKPLSTLSITHAKNLSNMRNAFTEPRKDIINNNVLFIENNKCGKIQELTVNLIKNENNNNNAIDDDNLNKNRTDNNNTNENNNLKNKENEVNLKDEKIVKNEEEANNETKDNNLDNNNDFNKDNNNEVIDDKNENNTNKENNENNTNENDNNNNNNTETVTIENNNDNNDVNAFSNDNNIIDTDESDDNVTKEIIVKDVSTRDKRLNVFIKYVELSEFNTLNNEFNDIHLFNSFQTDSIYFPPLYPKNITQFYYNNYYYGNKNNKNNKLKLHRILSSIIEEEERSKAAGSINNSYFSDEDMSKNGNNYSHFFIQSIKYVSSFLQSIFDDKKKDLYFQFIKILKKIKNEAFLRGLMNQKKLNSLNKAKDNNDNSSSKDVILYKGNESYNHDNSNLDSKSNEKKDFYKKNDNIEFNDSNKNIYFENVDKNNKNKSTDANRNNTSPNNFCLLDENKNNSDIDKSLKRNKSLSNLKENNNSYSPLDTSRHNYENKSKKYKKIDENKLKEIFENMDEYKNLRLVEKHFKFWKKIKNENENDVNSINERKEDSDIHIEYDRNVTMSEACRGLSDVILDFKLYLVKYCLKNKRK